jgi:phage gp36-like protein
MAYCTEDDLLKMIPQAELVDLTVDSGDVPDNLIIAEVISKADAEIDSYLGIKYMVPVSPTPDQVKALSVDLAIYHLYSRRNLVPPVRQQKYKDAVAFLKQVAAGQAVIMGPGGALPTTAREVADTASAVRCFTRNTQTDW